MSSPLRWQEGRQAAREHPAAGGRPNPGCVWGEEEPPDTQLHAPVNSLGLGLGLGLGVCSFKELLEVYLKSRERKLCKHAAPSYKNTPDFV